MRPWYQFQSMILFNLIKFFKGSMGDDMATTTDHLFPYDVGHVISWSTWDIPLMGTWEEIFYELPSSEVIHFIWMIAWGLDSLIWSEVP